MSRPSAVPPDTEMADILAARGEPGLDALIRMPPGPARQAAITRIVASLAVPLAALHEAGQVHGGICPAAVVHGPSGEPVLATPPVAPTPDAEDAPRQAGYAAFEQYTDDPAYSCGPWSDVYGLAALAYFLATGSAPPSALARRVRDDYVPLGDWDGNAYGKAFCDAIDSGLAMPIHARPVTVTSFAAAMGALPPAQSTATLMPTPELEPEFEPTPAPTPTPTPTDEPAFIPLAASPTDGHPADDDALARSTAGVSTQAPPEIPDRRRRMLPLMLVVLALLLAGGGYAWVRMTTPPVQLAGTPQTSSPAPARAPEGPPSAPPVGPEASPQALPQTAPQTAPQSTPQSTPPVAAAPAPATVPPVAEPIAEASPEPAPESASESASEASPPGAGPAAAAGTSDMPPPPVAEPPAPPKAAPVVVRVAVRPWGEVLINGRSRGVSPPLREISLAPGRYQVTVRNASAGDHSMTLTVAPNRPAIITHEFK